MEWVLGFSEGFQKFQRVSKVYTRYILSIVCSRVWFCHFVARSLRTLNAQIGMIMITSHNFQPRAPGRDASSGLVV